MHPLCDPGRIRPHTKQTLDDYGKHGLPPGDCLRAVLNNDLIGAYRRADDDTMASMPAIVWYVINRLPRGCYGSEAAVEMWIEERRAARDAERASGAV